jgi:phage terminase large subunit-like protein
MVTVQVPASLDLFASACGLELERFQRRIAKAMHGPERECVVLVARGQGKTHLSAIVALHHLVTVEDAAVYCCAAARDQARVLFEAAAKYARRLNHPNIVFRHHELRWCPDPDNEKVFTRHMRVLPAKDAGKLHGLTFTLAILDELQAFASDEVYIALNSALHKKQGAKLIVISTAAQGADSPLGKLRTRALALPEISRRGAISDAKGQDLRFLEWACSEDDDVDDPRVVKKANPASWISVDQLRAARASLPDLAHRRYVANQWTERAGHWLPPGSWQACVGDPQFTPGEKVWAAVDVGGERSDSAVAWVNEKLHAGVAIFHGDRGVLECVDLVRELAGIYQIVELTFDPMRAVHMAQELQSEGLRVSVFSQGDARMIPASNRLHAAVTDRRIVLPDDPELAQHAANTIAVHSRRGWRIGRPDPRTPNDAIVALAMAVDRLENRPEPPKWLGWMGPDSFERAS